MKRTIFAALSAWALAMSPAQADPVNAPLRAINPPLYVIRDADSAMYLFGTVHVRRPGANWGGTEAQQALASADEVWTEVIISPESDAETQSIIGRIGLAPRGEGVSTHLTPEQNARLNSLLQRLGVPAGSIEPMQPWLASLTLSVIPMLQAGYDPASGVDRAVDAQAETSGKRMSAFETIEEQIGFLAGFSEEQQVQMLLAAIEEAEKGPAELDRMVAAWEQGDLSLLEQLAIVEMQAEYPEPYDVVLVRRNRAWIETMVREMQGSGVDFIAVGAAHLLGEDGLVAMMQARGYTVERVNPVAP